MSKSTNQGFNLENVGRKYVYNLLATILTVYALVQAKDFLYPVAFAILIGYLLFH
ncbi:MAG: hypothetical protein HC896_01165 [Bacteroidales bacterium]|nr:hypothetical protein [Bacteroidales bacterium]